MRLSDDALIEIMSVVQRGILMGIDISQELRDIDLVECDERCEKKLCLSRCYVDSRSKRDIGAATLVE